MAVRFGFPPLRNISAATCGVLRGRISRDRSRLSRKPRYYEAKGDILGNVKTDGLKKLLCEGPYLSEVCATVGDLALINKKCGNCRFFKYCAGGCRAVALALTGDKMGSDPAKCLFYNNGWYGKVTAALSDMTNRTPGAIED